MLTLTRLIRMGGMRFPKPSTHPAWHIWPVCPAVSAVTWGRSVISAKDAASKHLQMSFTLCTLWKWACSSFMLLFIHLFGVGKVKWNRQKFWTAVGCVCVAACSWLWLVPKMSHCKYRFLGMYVWTGVCLLALQLLIDLSLEWYWISSHTSTIWTPESRSVHFVSLFHV